MAKKTLTEKQVVDYIVDNWDRLFAEHGIKYKWRERSPVSWWRVDLWGIIDSPLPDNEHYKACIFMEAKFRSESRDLIYELQKGLDLLKRIKNPNYLAVLSDDFSDPTILQFIQDNDIHMFKIELNGDDLDTLQIKYYEAEDHLVLDKLEG